MAAIRTVLAGALVLALNGLTAAAGPPPWLPCKSKIEAAHHALELALARRGNNSKEAQQRQRAYNDTRMWCWRAYRGWWDERYGRWRTREWRGQTL